MAAEVCSFLWKNSGSFNSISATLSISLGLDYNWHSMVHQCKELCKCFMLSQLSGSLSCASYLTAGGNVLNTCSCQKKVRNMVSWFGCFSVTVDCSALLVCLWERLVMLAILLVECHSIPQWPWCLSRTHNEGLSFISASLLYVMCPWCIPRASKMLLFAFDCYVLITFHEIHLLQWMTRRQAHLLRAQQGIPISEYGVSSGISC